MQEDVGIALCYPTLIEEAGLLGNVRELQMC